MTTTVVVALGAFLALLLVSMAWGRDDRIWQIVSGPPGESPNRIPLTEFCLAAQHHGWAFAADRRLFIDLAAGLREAGLAGTIEIWGRPRHTQVLRKRPAGPLARIPAGFWADHQIDGLREAIFVPGDGEEADDDLQARNAQVHTRAVSVEDPGPDDAMYRDIHLNYMQAMAWLESGARAWQGVSQRDGVSLDPGSGGVAPAAGPGEIPGTSGGVGESLGPGHDEGSTGGT